MNKKIIYILVGLALVFFITSLVIFLKSNKEAQKSEEPEVMQEVVEEEKPVELIKLKVFFYSRGSRYLRPIVREIAKPPFKEKLYKSLLDFMMSGAEKTVKPVPEGVSIRTLYFIEKEGMLVLDFSDNLLRQFPAGTAAELEFIYFFVDNFCYNFKEIKKVKFMVAGNDIKTLTGHIDMENAFYPDYRYLVDK